MRIRRWLAVLALLLGAGFLGSLATGAPAAAAAQRARPVAPVLRTDTIANVVEVRSKAVVFLHTIESGGRPGERFEGVGSGVMIDRAGSIVTNAHVVAGADVVHVRLPDGSDRAASVVGSDEALDIALLRLEDPRGFIPAPLGKSAGVRVGEWVIAIGNPLGLHHTVTLGIVSAKARSITGGDAEMLQTDAAINPGSSGGPLLNLRGEVIGITTAILSGTGEDAGLNFAIPIDLVKGVIEQWRVAGTAAPNKRSPR